MLNDSPSSLMSSSSSSPRTWEYNVFTSFHGPDVRKTFLSHLRKQFNFNGITMFDDQGIERSQIIAPALTKGIRESRIAIVLLSKNYASSSWCLDELLEILECKENMGQIVMSVFYGVDPSDVRKQTGDFGIAFNETCARKTEEERRNWSQALTYVGNIAGEHFQNWDNEAKMIEKIAIDVSDKLNATPSRDFDDMVGLDDHLRKMESLVDLDNVGVKSLDGKIESVLKLGYESLNEKDQALFLHIAIFFNYENLDHVISMLAKSNLDVKLGLKILANRCLIHIDSESRVVMHHLLQVMARQVISKQEPWKRQLLVDAQEICYVLENATGNGSTKGVSFDIAEIDELMISPRAFEKMYNLLFLKVYNVGCHTGKRKIHIPEDIEFPRRIRLFHWDAYPGKSLPLRFFPENLIELNMEGSELEKLWEGTQLLANLKTINLALSSRLKKLPDLSNATNLEALILSRCAALVELPSSITNLHKLNSLQMNLCKSLEVVPTLVNVVSLTWINMFGCSRLRGFPEIPTSVSIIEATDTTLEEFPASLRHCYRLEVININGSVNLKTFLTQLPTSVQSIDLSYSGIERITDCIKGLHNLQELCLSGCKRLASLPEFPRSLEILQADDCESLERVNGHLNTPNAKLNFTNCFKLDREARRAIIQQSFVRGWTLLPGIELPAEFDHRARGKSLIIPYSAFNKFKVCVVMSPNHHQARELGSRVLVYRWTVIGNSVKSDEMKFNLTPLLKGISVKLQKAHLFIFHFYLPFIFHIRNLVLEFISEDQYFDIIECGVQILTDETDSGCGLWDTHEFDFLGRYEFDDSSDKDEDDDEGYKSESRELSEDKDDHKSQVGNKKGTRIHKKQK